MSRLTDLRRAVTSVAEAGTRSVSIVRDSFATGEAPFQAANSGSVANYLNGFTDDDLGRTLVKGTARYGLLTAPGGTVMQPPRPELDEAAIEEDKNRGTIDQFMVRLTVSIAESDVNRAQTIKLFRADLGKIHVPRPTFGALMDAPVVAGKGADRSLSQAQRAAELGVGNVVTTFVAKDINSSKLSVTSPAERELIGTSVQLNTNKGTTPAGLVSITGADRSVVENITFYLNRRALGALPEPDRPPLSPGVRSGINVLKGSGISRVDSVVQESNAMEFTCVGSVSPLSADSRTIGQVVEMSFVDPTVIYGSRYAYYAATVGDNGQLGPRSRIVNVSVSRTVPPKAPEVMYGLTAGEPRFIISCAPGVDHVEVYRSGKSATMSSVLGSDQSLIISRPSNKVGDFYHAGDLGLGPDGTTCFIDRDIVPGDRVTYRFYSVDVYGMKSQTPFTCDMRIPAPGDRVPLGIPSITTEQVRAGDPSVRVSVTIDDDRVVGFVFSRRDITIGELAVHQANQPEHVRLGVTDPKRAGSRRSPTPLDLEWPSVVMSFAGSASFVDTSVRIDRVYQYGVYGIDRRGNRTFLAGAPPVGVYTKPTIDAPTDFKSGLVITDGEPRGVMLSWVPGTVDFSPNDLLDDQDVLAATSVRSAFQVERRQKGAPFWDAMPATTESYFFDPAGTEQAPTFRPAYVTHGLQYEYRVLAMQSGGFVSPRTDPVSIIISPPPPVPDTVWVRTTDLAVRPLNIVVSWNASGQFINYWEVQRAVTNKLFGSKISSMDSTVVRSLDYTTIAKVTPEASRAAGISVDRSIKLDSRIFVGRRFFIDPNANIGNCYFYRVRSIGKLQEASEWTYGGVQMVDHAFDRKFMSTLSDDMKVQMTNDSRPIPQRVKVR